MSNHALSSIARHCQSALSGLGCRIGVALALVAGMAPAAHAANTLLYPTTGQYNNASYTFTAVADGEVMAYMVGGFGAAYTNELSVLINGQLSSSGFGLNNHTSHVGQSFDLGTVHAGDTLTFVLRNYTLHQDVFSDASMNVSYDTSTAPGHNHIYSSNYNGSNTNYTGVPTGTFVAFEDQRFPNSDYNYNDLSFVFTNVATQVSAAAATAIPEPESRAMMLAGLVAVSLAVARRRRTQA